MSEAKGIESKQGTFRVELGADGVALVLMDVPGEPVNTLRAEFGAEFSAVADRLESDAAVKAIVIASGKADGFLAGADVQMLRSVKSAAEATALTRGGQKGFDRLEALGK